MLSYYVRIVLIFALIIISTGAAMAGKEKGQKPKKAQQNNSASLYQRIETRVQNDPAYAKQLEGLPEELKQVEWMVGNWDIVAKVYATPTAPERVSQGQAEIKFVMNNRWVFVFDTYPDGGVDEGYLTYNGFTKKWTSVTIDGLGNTFIATADKWQGNQIIFVLSDIQIVGERVTLRQTITKRSDSEYHVLNEEKLPNGKWVALDEYTYKKRAAK